MLVVVFLQQREVFFNFVRKSPSSICLHVCHPDLDLHWSLRDACWRGRVDVCCFSIKLLGSQLAYLKSLVSHCCTCSATLPFTAPEQVLDFAQRLQDKARKVGVQVTQHQDAGSIKKGSETSRPGTMKNTEESCVLYQILLSLWLFWNGVCLCVRFLWSCGCMKVCSMTGWCTLTRSWLSWAVWKSIQCYWMMNEIHVLETRYATEHPFPSKDAAMSLDSSNGNVGVQWKAQKLSDMMQRIAHCTYLEFSAPRQHVFDFLQETRQSLESRQIHILKYLEINQNDLQIKLWGAGIWKPKGIQYYIEPWK